MDQNPSLVAFSRRAISPAIFITQACSKMLPTEEVLSAVRIGAGVRYGTVGLADVDAALVFSSGNEEVAKLGLCLREYIGAEV